MRPDFLPDANKNDEDIFSDEDIDRERTDVQTLLHTHCGATRDDNQDDNREEKIAYEHSKDAIRRANRMWAECEKKGRKMEGVKLTYDYSWKYSDDEMKQLKKETLRSQSQANKSDSASNAGDAFFDNKSSYSDKNSMSFS